MASVPSPLSELTGTLTGAHRSTRNPPFSDLTMSDDLQLPDLETWQRLFDDQTLWQQSPDAHYFDLQRIADDLLGQGAIDLEQWQLLRAKADDLHKHSPEVNVARELDDPEA